MDGKADRFSGVVRERIPALRTIYENGRRTERTGEGLGLRSVSCGFVVHGERVFSRDPHAPTSRHSTRTSTWVSVGLHFRRLTRWLTSCPRGERALLLLDFQPQEQALGSSLPSRRTRIRLRGGSAGGGVSATGGTGGSVTAPTSARPRRVGTPRVASCRVTGTALVGRARGGGFESESRPPAGSAPASSRAGSGGP